MNSDNRGLKRLILDVLPSDAYVANCGLYLSTEFVQDTANRNCRNSVGSKNNQSRIHMP